MAEPLATTPIRYSFGADEHLFAEVSESMSLEAFFQGHGRHPRSGAAGA